MKINTLISVFAIAVFGCILANVEAVQEGGGTRLKLNEAILKLQEELVLLQEKRGEIESQYGQQHPRIKAIDETIESLMVKLFQLNPDYGKRLERLDKIEDTDARTVISRLMNRIDLLELRLEKLEGKSTEKRAP